MAGKLLSIHIAERSLGPPVSVEQATLVAGKGIVGDRRYIEAGNSPDKELTLVESEQIDRFNRRMGLALAPSALRRNLVTAGIRLPELVGTRFFIGEAEAEGIELCEPCATVGRLLATERVPAKRIVAELVHRAGLRARIVKSGSIRAGDDIGPAG